MFTEILFCIVLLLSKGVKQAKIIIIIIYRGRVDDLSLFEYLSPFCFLSIEFHSTFFISYKILPYFVIVIVFWLGCEGPSGLLLFVPASLLSIHTPLFYLLRLFLYLISFLLFPCASV